MQSCNGNERSHGGVEFFLRDNTAAISPRALESVCSARWPLASADEISQCCKVIF
jgi:hypothetical protein